jgi:hypothetical protein
VLHALAKKKDSREQSEWGLLVGAGNPAWEPVVLEAAPGARIGFVLCVMPRLIRLAGLRPKTRRDVGHGES